MKYNLKILNKHNCNSFFKMFVFLCFFVFFSLVSKLHAEILYFNNFNNNTVGQYSSSEFDKDWNNSFISVIWKKISNCTIVNDGNSLEGKSLKVRYAANTYGGGSGAQWLTEFKAHNEIYISYWCKFSSNFDFVKGGKMPGPAAINPKTGNAAPCGGTPADGTNGFSARGSWKSTSMNGAIHNYVYHTDQPTNYGETLMWDDGPSGTILGQSDAGEWHHYEMRVVINTTGKYDGIIQDWYDGVLVAERKNYRFKTEDTFKVDSFFFSTFFGGGDSSYAPSKDQYAYFDNIVISTERIGPIKYKTQSQVPLNPPGNLRVASVQ